MKTALFVFLVAALCVAVVDAIVKILRIKKEKDYARAKLAANRIRRQTGEHLGCGNVDIVEEVKKVLRYCRYYNVSLVEFKFNDESELIDEALKITVFASNSDKMYAEIRARLAPYFLKHATK